jgi:hypothetical protein
VVALKFIFSVFKKDSNLSCFITLRFARVRIPRLLLIARSKRNSGCWARFGRRVERLDANTYFDLLLFLYRVAYYAQYDGPILLDI